MSVTHASGVDASNAAQLKAWDGNEGAYWAQHADRFDRSIAAYQASLLEVAAIDRHVRVLDIGCGAGQVTCDAARAATSGSALGVDLSARMLDVARVRAQRAGVSNASFVQADAQVHAFPTAGFDVAVSRTGAMFFGDPVAAFRNIGRALVGHGRLVLMTWQPLRENEWIREISGALAAGRDLPGPPADAPGPFSLSDPVRVREFLGAAGFSRVDLRPMSAGMWFGRDAADARDFVLGLMGWLLADLDEAGRAGAVDALHALMERHDTPDGVVLGSSAWFITASR